MDQFVKQTLGLKHYFRYADDFIFVNHDLLYLKTVLFLVSDFITNKLNLSLHPNKIVVRKFTQGIDFLGYVLLPKYVSFRNKTKKRMFKKLKQKQVLYRNQEIETEKYFQTIQSYLGMLEHCDAYDLQNTIKNNFLFESIKKTD